jgi:hypothetical protein
MSYGAEGLRSLLHSVTVSSHLCWLIGALSNKFGLFLGQTTYKLVLNTKCNIDVDSSDASQGCTLNHNLLQHFVYSFSLYTCVLE